MSTLWKPRLLFMINLMKHWASTQVWAMYVHPLSVEDNGGGARYRSGSAHLHLPYRRLFHSMRWNNSLQPWWVGRFPAVSSCVCVWLHSSLEGHSRNNIGWSRVGWSKRAPLSVSVHHHSGVVSARNMLTCQLASSSADLFMHNPEIWPAADEQRSENCASREVAFRNSACAMEAKVDLLWINPHLLWVICPVAFVDGWCEISAGWH